ncbi:MAG: hypothetical protein RLZZ23_1006 [Verrucomicrobiota bacterium]|jgi:hypothetical protein
MKHILPILTITTLAAAASAQSAAASSGLSYNRVGLGYNTDSKGYSLTASALIGSSNFLVEAGTSIGGNTSGNGVDSVSLGYVFKNVALGADATVSVGSDESYGLNVRKDLGNNIELAVGYARSSGVNGWGAELAYNVSKQIQVAVGVSDTNAAGSSSTTDISVRYNF